MIAYFDSIPDKETYAKKKLAQFLTARTPEKPFREVMLPEPSYAISDKVEKMCNITPTRTVNAVIEDRPEVMSRIERYFEWMPLEEEMDGFAMRKTNGGIGSKIQILYGLPGAGKSFTACQYALTHANDYTVIWFMEAGTEAELQNSCSRFVETQNMDASDLPPEKQRQQFLDYFNYHENWLLIFDNVDYLDPQWGDRDANTHMREAFERYLPTNGFYGHILITTRCNIDFMAANRIAVEPFDTETAIHYLNAQSGLKDEDGAIRLAEELGRLPIALLYAGTYIRRYHVSSYQSYLDSYRKPSTRGKMKRYEERLFDERGQIKPIHRTLGLILERLETITGDPLTDQMQQALIQFWKVCAFVAPEHISLVPYIEDTVNLPAPLAYVLEDPVDCDVFAGELTAYSLFQYDGESQTFSLHRLLQEFMREQEGVLPEEWAGYSYHAIFKQYNLYKLGGAPERVALVRGLAPHIQVAMPYVVRAELDYEENLRIAEEYCLHNEKLNIQTSYNDIESFKAGCAKEINVFLDELAYLTAVGLTDTALFLVRVMLIGERMRILGDESWHLVAAQAFGTARDFLESYHPGTTFGKNDVGFLQALYVYAHGFRSLSETADAGSVWAYYRNILRYAGKLAGVQYIDDAMEYYNSLLSVFSNATELMAELTGKAIYSSAQIPYYYLQDGTPDFEKTNATWMIVAPDGRPLIYDMPYTIIEGNILRTYGFAINGIFSRPPKVRSDFNDGFDCIARTRDEAVRQIMDNEDKAGYVLALPEDCKDTEALQCFYQDLYQAGCHNRGIKGNQKDCEDYIQGAIANAQQAHDAHFHFLEHTPEMLAVERAEMKRMLDKISRTIKRQILPIETDEA